MRRQVLFPIVFWLVTPTPAELRRLDSGYVGAQFKPVFVDGLDYSPQIR